MSLLSEPCNTVNDPTALKRCPHFVDVCLGDFLSTLLNSNITSFHKQIEALAGVTSIFCTKRCTLRDHFLRYNTS